MVNGTSLVRPRIHILINLLKSMLCLVVACVIALIISMVFRFPTNSDWVLMLATFFAIPVVLYYYWKFKQDDFVKIFKIRLDTVPKVAFYIALGGIINIIFILCFNLMPDTIVASYKVFENDSVFPNFWINSFCILFISPLFEEIFFRGIFIYELEKGFSTKTTIFIQALFFAIMHENIIQIIYTFILAYILGVMVMKTKNLLHPFLLHFGFNVAGLLLFLVM